MTALGTHGTAAPIDTAGAIGSLDHLVLTISDLDATLRFYVDALGMRHATFGDGRHALHFGSQKINLHVAGEGSPTPVAARATPGSVDMCFLARIPIEGILRLLEAHDIPVEKGPVERVGATGSLLSIYVRDPDGNLVELANALDA